MEKKDLIKFLDRLFIPLGFKRKGNNWVINGLEINKIINLQKSQYSNSFYINYGYIINSLPLDGFVNHVDNRLIASNTLKPERLIQLLDLDSEIAPVERLTELESLIQNQIIIQMEATNSEKDILAVLKQQKFLHMTPPNVLKHFNLNLE